MKVEEMSLNIRPVPSGWSCIWSYTSIIRFHCLLHRLMESSSCHPPERLLKQVTEPGKTIHQKLIKRTCGLNDSLKRNYATYDFGCWSKWAHLRYRNDTPTDGPAVRSLFSLSAAFYFCLQMHSKWYYTSHWGEIRLCFFFFRSNSVCDNDMHIILNIPALPLRTCHFYHYWE